jgi:hypothetical protein
VCLLPTLPVVYLFLVRPMKHNVKALIATALSYGLAIPLQADDISAREAWRLASTYMLCHVSGCGGTKEPVARGTFWEVPVLFGYAGSPHGSIHIDRATGLITYSYAGHRYPTVSPKQLAQEEYDLVHRY